MSLRYPLTELLTAAISGAGRCCRPIAACLPPCCSPDSAGADLIDIEHLLLPDALTLSLLWLGLLFKALHWLPGTLHDAVFGAVGDTAHCG